MIIYLTISGAVLVAVLATVWLLSMSYSAIAMSTAIDVRYENVRPTWTWWERYERWLRRHATQCECHRCGKTLRHRVIPIGTITSYGACQVCSDVCGARAQAMADEERMHLPPAGLDVKRN